MAKPKISAKKQPEPVQPVSAPPVTKSNAGVICGVTGIICAALSILILPIIFGPAAIILGYLAKKKGEQTLGLVAIILGAVFMVIGMLLGIAAYLLLPKLMNSTA